MAFEGGLNRVDPGSWGHSPSHRALGWETFGLGDWLARIGVGNDHDHDRALALLTSHG